MPDSPAPSDSLRNHLRESVTGCWIAVTATVALGLALLPLHESAAVVALIFAGLLGVFTLTGELDVRSVEKQLAALRRGEYLAHWTYTPAEWDEFRQSPDAADLPVDPYWYVPGVGSLTGFISGAVLSCWVADQFLAEEIGNNTRFVWWMLAFAVGTSVGVSVGWGAHVLVRRCWAAERQRPAEVFLGREVLYINGGVNLFGPSVATVLCADLKTGPPAAIVLCLRDTEDSRLRWWIPVPTGREAEAEQVTRELTRPASPTV